MVVNLLPKTPHFPENGLCGEMIHEGGNENKRDQEEGLPNTALNFDI